MIETDERECGSVRTESIQIYISVEKLSIRKPYLPPIRLAHAALAREQMLRLLVHEAAIGLTDARVLIHLLLALFHHFSCLIRLGRAHATLVARRPSDVTLRAVSRFRSCSGANLAILILVHVHCFTIVHARAFSRHRTSTIFSRVALIVAAALAQLLANAELFHFVFQLSRILAWFLRAANVLVLQARLDLVDLALLANALGHLVYF